MSNLERLTQSLQNNQANFKLKGNIEAVTGFLGILLKTEEKFTSRDWWRYRASILAKDYDMMGGDLGLLEGLKWRKN